jgi:hypothetical protein
MLRSLVSSTIVGNELVAGYSMGNIRLADTRLHAVQCFKLSGVQQDATDLGWNSGKLAVAEQTSFISASRRRLNAS